MYGYKVVVQKDVLDTLVHYLEDSFMVVMGSVLQHVYQVDQEVWAVVYVSVVNIFTHCSYPHLGECGYELEHNFRSTI